MTYNLEWREYSSPYSLLVCTVFLADYFSFVATVLAETHNQSSLGVQIDYTVMTARPKDVFLADYVPFPFILLAACVVTTYVCES
jgi:hypothetical protein